MKTSQTPSLEPEEVESSLKQQVRKELGLSADASDEQVRAKVETMSDEEVHEKARNAARSVSLSRADATRYVIHQFLKQA